MSVEKLDFTYVRQQKKTFTTYLNDVIQSIRDGFTLAVYIYLGSLPPDWSINKQHLMNHFGVGRDKIQSALTWMHRNKLIEYDQKRNSDGTLSTSGIVVKDGQEYIEEILKKQLLNTATLETRTVANFPDSTALLKIRNPDNPDSGKSAPTKYIDNTKQNKKRESTLAQKRRSPLSENFKPDEKNQELLQERSKECHISEENLLLKFVSLKKNESHIDWQQQLTLFLLNEKPLLNYMNKEFPRNSQNEQRCTVPDWGPGHPSYDSLHGLTKQMTH